MGPLTHAASSRLAGGSVPVGVLLDLPNVIGWKRGMEHSHGVTGLALAALLAGRRGVVSWCVHVALDTISHRDGGATGRQGHVWLP